MGKTIIDKWINRTINGSGGFKMQEDREIMVYKDREVGIAEFVIRALANPKCKGSKEVVEAILARRGDILKPLAETLESAQSEAAQSEDNLSAFAALNAGVNEVLREINPS